MFNGCVLKQSSITKSRRREKVIDHIWSRVPTALKDNYQRSVRVCSLKSHIVHIVHMVGVYNIILFHHHETINLTEVMKLRLYL